MDSISNIPGSEEQKGRFRDKVKGLFRSKKKGSDSNVPGSEQRKGRIRDKIKGLFKSKKGDDKCASSATKQNNTATEFTKNDGTSQQPISSAVSEVSALNSMSRALSENVNSVGDSVGPVVPACGVSQDLPSSTSSELCPIAELWNVAVS